MSTVSPLGQLNQRFECPQCATRGTWQASAKPQVRINSAIFRLSCAACGYCVVAKSIPLAKLRAGDQQLGKNEYDTLLMLQSVFPQSGQYGTLDPQGYFEFEDCGVLLTRAFAGHSLPHHARMLDVESLCQMYRSAGTLLRILHDCSPEAGPMTLEAGARIASLKQNHAARLAGNRVVRAAFETLQREAVRFDALPLRSAWSHGDFKPGNVLYDGRRSVMLDTELKHHSAVVYDIASFIDHLLLAKHRGDGVIRHRSQQQFEREFLAGYGDMGELEMAALRWMQLYFMLWYWGRDQQRGPLVAWRAKVTMLPLIKVLVAQCENPTRLRA